MTKQLNTDKSFYKDIRDRLDEQSDVITELFQEALQKLKAEGFLGCEGIDGYIQIFTCEGKYFHLSKDKGFTATVFSSGKAQICKIDETKIEEPGKRTLCAEMAAPIKLDDRVVGVILVDRYFPVPFENKDLQLLEAYGNNFSDILSQKEPWPFRTWWKNKENQRMEMCRNELNLALTDELESYENVTASTSLFKDGGMVETQQIHLGSNRVFDSQIADQVISSGVSAIIPQTVKRGELAIPFPATGAMKGLVSIETYPTSDSARNKDDVDEALTHLKCNIEKVVNRVKFDYLKPIEDRDDPGSKFYAIVIECLSRNDDVVDIIDSVKQKVRALCNSRVEIAFEKILHKSFIKKDQSTYTGHDESELREKYIPSDHISKRHQFSVINSDAENESWIVCPLWIGTKLVGGIQCEIKDKDQAGVAVVYNGPFIEAAAGAIGVALSAHIRRLAFRNILMHTQTCKHPRNQGKTAEIVCSELMRASSADFACILQFRNDSNDSAYVHAISGYQCNALFLEQVGQEICRIKDLDTSRVGVHEEWIDQDLKSLSEVLKTEGLNAIAYSRVSPKSECRYIFIIGLVADSFTKTNFSVEDQMDLEIISGLVSNKLTGEIEGLAT